MNVFDLIRTAALNSGAPGYPGRHGTVRSSVGYDFCFYRLYFSVFRESHLIINSVRMSLVTFTNRPFACVRAFHGLARQFSGEGCSRGDDRNRIVLAAESAAHRCADNFHVGKPSSEHGINETPRAERMLHARINFYHAVVPRIAYRGLGLHIRVLDELSLKNLFEYQAGVFKTVFNVSSSHAVLVYNVASVLFVNERAVRLKRFFGVEYRRNRFRFEFNESGRFNRVSTRVGDNERDYVTVVKYPVFREYPEIFYYLSEAVRSRNVFMGQHFNNTFGFFGIRCVD